MADRAPVKRGNYCVAGSRENVSRTNTIYSPVISMHRFPSDKELLFPHALGLSLVSFNSLSNAKRLTLTLHLNRTTVKLN